MKKKINSKLVKEKIKADKEYSYGDICNLLGQKNWGTHANPKNAQLRVWRHYFSYERPRGKRKYVITKIHDVREYDAIKDCKLTIDLVKQQLIIGAEYTYEELCYYLGQSLKGSREATRKRWRRFFCWKREKNIYIITDIYDEEQGYERYALYDNRFLISKDDMNRNGVYIIQLDYQVYIGSTTDGFRDRYRKHKCKSSILQEVVTMLGQGATFDALWIVPPTATEAEVREIEAYYIYLCKNASNYDCVNTRIHTYCCSKSA
nr:hypothetical protein [uncultured Anaerosporobacter sp.]